MPSVALQLHTRNIKTKSKKDKPQRQNNKHMTQTLGWLSNLTPKSNSWLEGWTSSPTWASKRLAQSPRTYYGNMTITMSKSQAHQQRTTLGSSKSRRNNRWSTKRLARIKSRTYRTRWLTNLERQIRWPPLPSSWNSRLWVPGGGLRLAIFG